MVGLITKQLKGATLELLLILNIKYAFYVKHNLTIIHKVSFFILKMQQVNYKM